MPVIFKPDSLQINNFINTTKKINVPVFNAIGNHEADNWQMYRDYFGQTFLGFNYGNNAFMLIDLEMHNEKEFETWMQGEELNIQTGLRGIIVIKYKNNFIGCGKSSENKIGNFIPKSRRLRSKNIIV